MKLHKAKIELPYKKKHPGPVTGSQFKDGYVVTDVPGLNYKVGIFDMGFGLAPWIVVDLATGIIFDALYKKTGFKNKKMIESANESGARKVDGEEPKYNKENLKRFFS